MNAGSHICLPLHLGLSKGPLMVCVALCHYMLVRSCQYSQGVIYLMISTNHFLGNPAVPRHAWQNW